MSDENLQKQFKAWWGNGGVEGSRKGRSLSGVRLHLFQNGREHDERARDHTRVWTRPSSSRRGKTKIFNEDTQGTMRAVRKKALKSDGIGGAASPTHGKAEWRLGKITYCPNTSWSSWLARNAEMGGWKLERLRYRRQSGPVITHPPIIRCWRTGRSVRQQIGVLGQRVNLSANGLDLVNRSIFTTHSSRTKIADPPAKNFPRPY